jgi:hypothetical protein
MKNKLKIKIILYIYEYSKKIQSILYIFLHKKLVSFLLKIKIIFEISTRGLAIYIFKKKVS